jgi:hypothetical protein
MSNGQLTVYMEYFVSTNWGGTPVQDWSSTDALNKCQQTVGDTQIEQIGH